MKRRIFGLILISTVSLPATAFAEGDGDVTPAPAAPEPSMTLDRGGVFAQVNFEVAMSSGAAFKPVSIAPDVSYGVTSDLTLALEHSNYALTGFRGAAGAGLCVTGTANGCPNVHQDVGVEALYSLAKGSLAVAVDAGIIALDLRPVSPSMFDFDLKIGAKAKYTSGTFYVVAMPSIWFGLSHRTTDVMGVSTTLNGDRLYVPISGWFKVSSALAIGAGTGINGPSSGFGNAYKISLGFLGQFSINRHLAVGGSLVFGKVLGGAPTGATNNAGFDARAVQLWLNYTM